MIEPHEIRPRTYQAFYSSKKTPTDTSREVMGLAREVLQLASKEDPELAQVALARCLKQVGHAPTEEPRRTSANLLTQSFSAGQLVALPALGMLGGPVVFCLQHDQIRAFQMEPRSGQLHELPVDSSAQSHTVSSQKGATASLQADLQGFDVERPVNRGEMYYHHQSNSQFVRLLNDDCQVSGHYDGGKLTRAEAQIAGGASVEIQRQPEGFHYLVNVSHQEKSGLIPFKKA